MCHVRMHGMLPVVPFAEKPSGHRSKQAVRCVHRLGGNAAGNKRTHNSVFVHCPTQQPLIAVQKGTVEMYHWSCRLVTPCWQGVRHDPEIGVLSEVDLRLTPRVQVW